MADRSTTERIALLAVRARIVGRAGRNAHDARAIRSVFNSLALTLHPDVGGSAASFELLVQAKDQLLAEIAHNTTVREGFAQAPTETSSDQRSIAS
jgi:hypothetical protein